MARRLARWTLRGIKGALAVVALAALVAWPWSYGSAGQIEWWRWNVGEARVDAMRPDVAWGQGRVGLGWSDAVFTNVHLNYARRRAAAAGAGWSRKQNRLGLYWEDYPSASSWGPFRWKVDEIAEAGRVASWHGCSLPCYLLALLTGAWPLASAVRFARRRRRASLRLRLNLCRRCGYDLRATPSAGGATHPICPECGTAAGNDESRNSKSESMTKSEGRMTKR